MVLTFWFFEEFACAAQDAVRWRAALILLLSQSLEVKDVPRVIDGRGPAVPGASLPSSAPPCASPGSAFWDAVEREVVSLGGTQCSTFASASRNTASGVGRCPTASVNAGEGALRVLLPRTLSAPTCASPGSVASENTGNSVPRSSSSSTSLTPSSSSYPATAALCGEACGHPHPHIAVGVGAPTPTLLTAQNALPRLPLGQLVKTLSSRVELTAR